MIAVWVVPLDGLAPPDSRVSLQFAAYTGPGPWVSGVDGAARRTPDRVKPTAIRIRREKTCVIDEPLNPGGLDNATSHGFLPSLATSARHRVLTSGWRVGDVRLHLSGRGSLEAARGFTGIARDP